MLSPTDFYADYDNIIVRLCKPYTRFMNTAAASIPSDVQTICDIGIGTGNLSKAAKTRLPGLKVIGIDGNSRTMAIAQEKIAGLEAVIGDVFSGELPKADYYVSSLTLHHLDVHKRQGMLKKILESGRGLINFDIFLSGGRSKEDAITEITDFAAKSFPDEEDRRMIAEEMRKNDHPAQIYCEAEMIKKAGFRFDIIAAEFPFFVYLASRR